MSEKKCFKCEKILNDGEFLPGKFGTCICHDCISQHNYFVCSECGNAIDRMFKEWYQDEIPVCSSCMQAHFCYCYECGEHMHIVDAKIVEFGTKLCEKCWIEIEGNKIIHDHKYKPNPVFFGEDKYYLGIEVEIYSAKNRNSAMEVFKKWNNHSMYIKKDTSLSESGFEIVSHPHSFQALKEAKWLKAIECLEDFCTAFGKAGIHVHIGREAFDSNAHYSRFWSIWNEYPELIEWIAQRKNDQWAKLKAAKSSSKAVKVNQPREHTRHCAVNENNIHTVEVRVFNSHLIFSKIMKNIEFTHAVIEYTRHVDSISMEGLWKYIQRNEKLYPELLKFRNENRGNWEKAMRVSALRDGKLVCRGILGLT